MDCWLEGKKPFYKLFHSQKCIIKRIVIRILGTKLPRISMWPTNGMLYISTSIWLLHIPNASTNMLFQCFLCKSWKRKKNKNIEPNFAKKKFLSLHTNSGWEFYCQESQKCEKAYLEQRLECAAPEHWSKYTAMECPAIERLLYFNVLFGHGAIIWAFNFEMKKGFLCVPLHLSFFAHILKPTIRTLTSHFPLEQFHFEEIFTLWSVLISRRFFDSDMMYKISILSIWYCFERSPKKYTNLNVL